MNFMATENEKEQKLKGAKFPTCECVLYRWSLVKLALVASVDPCAPMMGRTHCAVTPSHTRTEPSFEAVTYILPVDEYRTCTEKF